ncbi:MAG: hypothetical protein Q9227_006854 [Pyrenula ochraceoflavens]
MMDIHSTKVADVANCPTGSVNNVTECSTSPSVESEPNKRMVGSPYIRPINQCPYGRMPRHLAIFDASMCELGRGPRQFVIWCVDDPAVPGPRSGWRRQISSGRCSDDEVCFQALGWTAEIRGQVAYCANVVNIGQRYLSEYTARRSSRQVELTIPREADRVETHNGQLVNAMYGPSDGVDIFELTLTGEDRYDTLFWAKHLKIQALKNDAAVGTSVECDDCNRQSIKGWPREANRMRVTVDVKNARDRFTINYVRFLGLQN